MTNDEYWIKRANQRFLMGEKTANELLTTMKTVYNNSLKDINKEIEAFYGRYAENNNLTITEVNKRLDPKELKSAKEGSLELLLDGNADYAPLSCTVAPSSTMTKFTLMSNSDTIKLEGLSIDDGNKLLINNDNFILSIKDNNGDSKLNNLLDSSDDNIRLNPGIVNKIKFVSDVNCDVKISSKGCWK